MTLELPPVPETADQLQAYIDALEAIVRKEVEAIDAQIASSRSARNGPAYDPEKELCELGKIDYSLAIIPLLQVQEDEAEQPPPAASEETPSKHTAEPAVAAAASPNVSQPAAAPNTTPDIKRDQSVSSAASSSSKDEAARTTGAASPNAGLSRTSSARDSLFEALHQAKSKGGMLSNWGKKGFFRSFNDHYVVVDEQGVRWFKSEREVRGGKPMDSIPWYVLTTNSRGSRFKNAAVCWPLITTQECPKATDRNKTYFGIQYTDPKSNELEFLVFGAPSPQDRDEWVFVITKYIKLYLAPAPEFMEFENMRVGSERPAHMHGVIDGEAPR